MRKLLNYAALTMVLTGLSVAAHAALPVTSLSEVRLGGICWYTANSDTALACWLNENPNVAAAMFYQDATYFGSWPTWPGPVKEQLFRYFDKMVQWYDDGMPPSTAPQFFPEQIPAAGPPDPTDGLWMPDNEGTRIYLSQVANSLAAELTARFPWSIATYTPSQLGLLLYQTDTMVYESNVAEPGYYFQYDGTGASPANPPFTALFFKTNHLIGTDAADTIARLFYWEKQLTHFFIVSGTNETTASVYPFFWGPNTPPIPDAEVIDGTTYTGPITFGFRHFTAGCSGTMEFMKSVLRTVNIPAENQWVTCGHATPIFPTAGVAMTHGDDPYTWSAWVTPYPGFPAPAPSEYLISTSDYNQLFPPGQSQDACTANVGIQPLNVAIKYGSDYLMSMYCEDLATGADPANGEVYAYLQDYYSLQTLQNMGLWTTLANKQTALNYCATIW